MKELFGPFFHPDAIITSQDSKIRITLPDERTIEIDALSLSYHHPNANPLPPFDFRDQLGQRKDGK